MNNPELELKVAKLRERHLDGEITKEQWEAELTALYTSQMQGEPVSVSPTEIQKLRDDGRSEDISFARWVFAYALLLSLAQLATTWFLYRVSETVQGVLSGWGRYPFLVLPMVVIIMVCKGLYAVTNEYLEEVKLDKYLTTYRPRCQDCCRFSFAPRL